MRTLLVNTETGEHLSIMTEELAKAEVASAQGGVYAVTQTAKVLKWSDDYESVVVAMLDVREDLLQLAGLR